MLKAAAVVKAPLRFVVDMCTLVLQQVIPSHHQLVKLFVRFFFFRNADFFCEAFLVLLQ